MLQCRKFTSPQTVPAYSPPCQVAVMAHTAQAYRAVYIRLAGDTQKQETVTLAVSPRLHIDAITCCVLRMLLMVVMV